jgi:hypothetical protein
MKIDSKDIDVAVEAVLTAAKNGIFSTADVLSRLTISPEDMEAEKLRIERELDADDNLFKDADKNVYVMRSKFFAGREFIITPSELEIENNILFPGHRFCTFCNEEIFLSEITLLDANSGNDLDTREFKHEVTELVPYHIFLGSEQIFDYFIAEHPSNESLLDEKTSQRNVTLNVFDLKEFYADNNFTSGDALLVTVKDWTEGVFSFSYLSGTERRNSKVKDWINELGRAVEMVIDRFEAYLEIPDQLRWAFFMGDELLWGKDAGSLDEFYTNSDRIEINFSNASHTILARKITAQSDDMEIPENVGISSGKISSLGELLEDVDSPLKAVEIDAYIMSQFYLGSPDFDMFFRRCFGMKKLSFADDAQEIIFLNYLEDRWETISAQYNLHADRPKAQLREQVLEFIDERLELLENLKSMDISPEQLPEDEIKKMAEVSIYFIELLEVLNSESHTLKEEDSEEIAEAIGRMGEIQDEQIDKINSYLKI